MPSAISVPHGINEENIKIFEDTPAGPVSNGANYTMQIPTQFVGTGMLPHAVRAYTISAGSTVGARTWLAQAFTLVSYNEATGALVLTNASGGSLSNFRVQAVFYATGA